MSLLLPTLLATFDARGTLTSANAALSRWFGIDAGIASGSRLSALLSGRIGAGAAPDLPAGVPATAVTWLGEMGTSSGRRHVEMTLEPAESGFTLVVVDRGAALGGAGEGAGLRAILDVLPDSVFVKDTEGRYRFINAAGARIIGRPPDDVLGRTDAELFPASVAARLTATDREVLQDPRGRVRIQRDVLHSDVVVEVIKGRMPETTHGRGGVFGIARDITERQRQEDRVRSSEQLFRSTFEHAVVGIVLGNPDGTIRRANPEFANFLGVAPEDLQGRHFGEFSHPDEMDSESASLEDVLAGRAPRYVVEKRFLNADGRYRHGLLSVSIVRDATGAPGTLIAVIQDITGQRLAQERLREAGERALAAAQAKLDFLARVSHELRTPLNAVLGMLSLLAFTDLGPDQRRLLDTADMAGSHLLELVNGVLDHARLEAGKFELARVDFDAHALVGEALDLVAVAASAKGLDLRIEIDPKVPRRLCGDPDRIRQVLVNFAANAVKFTGAGTVTLRLVPGEEQTAWRFEVVDTGVGIEDGDRGRLFETFSQVGPASDFRDTGAGLGLAISRGLVELMGGRIGVESAHGCGSTFWFEIPLGTAAVESGGASRPAATVLLTGGTESPASPLARYLEHAGVRVLFPGDEARLSSGGEAVAVLDATAVSGLREAIAALRAATRCPLRVLVTIPPATGEGHADAMAAGADAVLTRPLQPARLLDWLSGIRATPRAAAPVGVDRRRYAGRRALVVDDNPANRMVAEGLLAALGLSVDSVDSGAAAIEACAGTHFDIVFMDCQMPGMDGDACAARLRGSDLRMPIIAMTANQYAARDGAARNMDDVLGKPYTLPQLEAVLQRWLVPEVPRVVAPGTAPAGDVLDGERVAMLLEAMGAQRFRDLGGALAETATGASDALRGLAAGASPESARRSVHSLAGVAGNLGAVRLQGLARSLERDLSAGDLGAVTSRLAELGDEVGRALDELRRVAA